MHVKFRSIAFLFLAISTALAAQSIPQPTSASTAATRDTSYIDAQGTAYVTRVVPVSARPQPGSPQISHPNHPRSRTSGASRTPPGPNGGVGRAPERRLEQALPQHDRRFNHRRCSGADRHSIQLVRQ